MNEDLRNEIESLMLFDNKYLNIELILEKVKSLHLNNKFENQKSEEKLIIEEFIDKNHLLSDI